MFILYCPLFYAILQRGCCRNFIYGRRKCSTVAFRVVCGTWSVTHPLGLFPAEKKDDPMWCNRVSHVKDVWAMYPDLVGRVTVQCMSALYRLQALQSDAMAHLANLAQTTKLTLDSREDFMVDLSSELVEKDLQVERLSQRITTLEQQVEIRDTLLMSWRTSSTMCSGNSKKQMTTWTCTTWRWRPMRPKAREKRLPRS
jgi:hypothetical protein